MTRVFVSSVSVGLEAIRAQIIVDLQTANWLCLQLWPTVPCKLKRS